MTRIWIIGGNGRLFDVIDICSSEDWLEYALVWIANAPASATIHIRQF